MAVVFASALMLAATASAQSARFPKMDRSLEQRAVDARKTHKTTIIVMLEPGTDLPADLQKFSRFGRLNAIDAHVLDIPDDQLKNVATLPQAVHVHADGVVRGLDFRTDITSGSFFVNHNIGLTGAGVTVAVVDSGIAKVHDDLPPSTVKVFRDFVNNKPTRYDDFGHGTHVAGIVAGNGTDSKGLQAGLAPGAQLVVLKVLDANGTGTVANVLSALDWLAVYGPLLNVRVVNLSFGAKPEELPELDPLALATRTLVDRGMVVVAAAGNDGESNGKKVWGGIPSPADAPWVLTVGASSTLGTVTRKDDQMASFSSRGPAVGRIAKPDIVASGVGTISTISREGSLYSEFPNALVSVPCALPGCTGSITPYMSMSGTSMAAPVVSGTVALMLQANPKLTPNLVKAILEYTAEWHSLYSPLEQGAGFLNTLGAVRLAKFFASGLPASQAPFSPAWSRHINWGNHSLTGGVLQPKANAWHVGIRWGQRRIVRSNGTAENIIWGTAWGDDNIIWGTSLTGDSIVWGTGFGDDNIVWGTECGGANCGDNIIWGTWLSDDNVIWGTFDSADNIIWGTDDGDNIIWGTDDTTDNIVWGTDWSLDNIIWGTDDTTDNIIWGTALAGDNIIWGTGFAFKIPFVNVPPNPDPDWFNNAQNDLRWMQIQFGDSLPNLRSSAR